MNLRARSIAIAAALLLPCHARAASTVNEASLAGVRALFGASAIVQDFEGLAGAATGTLTDGTPIPAANQLSVAGSGLPDVQSLPGLHFHSGGGTFGGGPGTPVAVLSLEGALAGTPSSPTNGIAPLEINTDLLDLGAGSFLEIFFDDPVLDVALWTSGPVSVFGQTYGGNPLDLATATGAGGEFVGLRRDTPDIERLVIVAGSAAGFLIDDLVYQVPEPGTALLVALGFGALAARRPAHRAPTAAHAPSAASGSGAKSTTAAGTPERQST
ncbi:MAG: hypothetical protein DCC71_16470 [Proteobacteria bacterium]|nr:MAG: hypothetical protein DCC71_16470 [Pseudomonadota bacterium]